MAPQIFATPPGWPPNFNNQSIKGLFALSARNLRGTRKIICRPGGGEYDHAVFEVNHLLRADTGVPERRKGKGGGERLAFSKGTFNINEKSIIINFRF